MDAKVWQVLLEVPRAAVAAFEAALGDEAAAVTAMEQPGKADWLVDILYEEPPEHAHIAAAIAGAATEAGIAEPSWTFAPLAPRDWVGETQRLLAPLPLGRFWVHGEHDRGTTPAGRIGLEVEASIAFGTGRHATTAGCLWAIETLGRRRRFTRPLDVGCGSGVLAMAAAKLLCVPVLACDIDPGSVRVARANARANGLYGRVRAIEADGLSAREIQVGRPYDLILANILARPLTRLAKPIAEALAPNGRVVLSGLLAAQERQVLGAYALVGLRLEARRAQDGWHTLVLAPGTGRPRRSPR
jgi:ribosomal protein L11 methyltransferase